MRMDIKKWLATSLVCGGSIAPGAWSAEPIVLEPATLRSPRVSPTSQYTEIMPASHFRPGHGHGWRPAPQYLPPSVIPPTEPKKGEEPKKVEEPKKGDTPPDPMMPNPLAPNPQASNQLAGATEAGTQPSAQFNPYMFGDRFGAGRSTSTARVGSLVGQAFLTNNGASNTIVTLGSTNAVFGIPITNSNIVAASDGDPNLTFPRLLPSVATSGPISTTVNTAVTGVQTMTILFPVPGTTFPGGGVPLQNNATFQNYIDAVFKSRFGSNGQTVFTSASLSAGEGTTGSPGTQPGAAYQFNFAPDSIAYFAYDYITAISLPLPSSGGVVGVTKIAENNSPMPRDRIIFDYDYFSNVPLTANGFDVSRFSPGFEKTFFNNRASFEMRFPFASTVDPSSFSDGLSNRATVFGNLNLVFKGLFYASEPWNFSAGFGVAIPTAPDTRLRLSDGTDAIRIENQTWLLTPYVAGLWTPNERFYSQMWAQLSMDASGSPVSANPNLTGLIGAGRIYDQTLLQLDWQAGYWLVRDPDDSAFLTGLAPFVELHYNTPINDATIVKSGSFVIGSSTNRFDELNISAGVNTVLRNRVNLLAGVVAPLGSGDGKFFDVQFGLRMNLLFGPSDDRTSFVSGF
jgi:hypothetical protein